MISTDEHNRRSLGQRTRHARRRVHDLVDTLAKAAQTEISKRALDARLRIMHTPETHTNWTI